MEDHDLALTFAPPEITFLLLSGAPFVATRVLSDLITFCMIVVQLADNSDHC